MYDHSPLLAAWRQLWTASPYPQLVDHHEGPPEQICPAPSLWSGGKAVYERLEQLGARPGERLGVVLRGGAAWVQAMLGARRARVVFEPLGAGALASLRAEVRPHWLVEGADLEPRRTDSAAPLCVGAAWRLAGEVLSEAELLAESARLERVYPQGRARRVLSLAPWRDPEGALFAFSALRRGAELHLGLSPAHLGRLDPDESWPELLAAAPPAWSELLARSERGWARSLRAGVVLGGDAEEWGELPWSLTSWSPATAPLADGAAP
ncbi:MAG TPA: hypothetical protein DEA08_15975 [Planctomycetes bacterium]|nr:hypothetical protein [Planctomycetota bacterium]